MSTFKKFLSVICAIVLFLGMFSVADNVLMRKGSKIRFQQFFDDSSNYDVIFFGSSHVMNSMSPLDLFHNHGITSYNLATDGIFFMNSYYQMEEIAESFKDKLPKKIVLDVSSGGNDLPWLHNAWDCFGISPNKIRMAKSLANKNWLELIFPFILYHGRWNEALKELDTEPSKLYGVNLRYGVGSPNIKNVVKKTETKLFDEIYLEYLQKIYIFCKEKGIDLILMFIPATSSLDRQKEANYIYEFAKERDIPYVNFMNEDIGMDYIIDFYDDGKHVNPVGMRILTDEIGKLLLKEGVKDRRQEPIAKRWEREYRDYIDYRINRLKGLKKIKEFLMACNDPDLNVKLELDERLLRDNQIKKLIERLQNIEGNEIKLNSGKVTHTKPDKKTQKCNLSAVVFRRDTKKEVFRTAFNASEADFSSSGNDSRPLPSLNFITGRIDVRNSGADTNTVEVTNLTDTAATVRPMSWVKTGGNGQSIESAAGTLTARVRCKGDGKLQIHLRGRDVRGKDGKRVPYWIDYTSFTINGKPMFTDHKNVWHDKPHMMILDVKDGDIVEISATWKPGTAPNAEAPSAK